jgi:hypothetical protein
MLLLVFLDIDEITSLPRLPQPINPILIAEFALEPKTIPGFKIENAETAVALFKNVLRCIIFDLFRGINLCKKLWNYFL